MGPLDTHAHLADLPDVDAVIQRAKAAGLSGIVAVSATAATCEGTLRLQGSHEGFVHAALGVHPTEFFDQDLEAALALIGANSGRCVAVGEIGLDYWHRLVRKDGAQRGRQTEFYVAQLRLARELDLPVSIHSRGAWGDCLSLALQHGPGRGVFHWYSGPPDVLARVLDSGYYVSCTPALEGSPELRAAMERAPLERILVETDSPVWIKSQGRASEPADVLLTLRHLADLKGLPLGDVEAATTGNAETLFNLRSAR
ncbi:MAG: TatD family hydrolase [Candidatus Bathyarchaeota archaeon]|nr:TatD family hydrolase [Candidatus Bathyarchaeota archaeon]